MYSSKKTRLKKFALRRGGVILIALGLFTWYVAHVVDHSAAKVALAAATLILFYWGWWKIK